MTSRLGGLRYGITSLPGDMVRIYEDGKDLGVVERVRPNGYRLQGKFYRSLPEIAAALKGENQNAG